MPRSTTPESVEQSRDYRICSFTVHTFSENDDAEVVEAFAPHGVVRIKVSTYIGDTLLRSEVISHSVTGDAFIAEMVYTPSGTATMRDEIHDRLYLLCVEAGIIPGDAVEA